MTTLEICDMAQTLKDKDYAAPEDCSWEDTL